MENSVLNEKLKNFEESESFQLSGLKDSGYKIETNKCIETANDIILTLSKKIITNGKEVLVTVKTFVDKTNPMYLCEAKSIIKGLNKEENKWIEYDNLDYKHYFIYIEFTGLFNSDIKVISLITAPIYEYRNNKNVMLYIYDPNQNRNTNRSKHYNINNLDDLAAKELKPVLKAFERNKDSRRLSIADFLHPSGAELGDGVDFIKQLYKNIEGWIYSDFVRDSSDPYVEYSISRLVNKYDLPAEMKGRLLKDFGDFIDAREKRQTIVNRNDKTPLDKHIPNYSFLGNAGVGKTSLAKDMAKLFGCRLFIISAGQLKGSYVGQTMSKVYRLLAENDHLDQHEKFLPDGNEIPKDTLLDDMIPTIICIDESYELANDAFGREAISYLLPVLSHDKQEITYRVRVRDIEKTISHRFKKWPVIWLAGYEQDMHDKLFSKNTGLERRMTHLSINTPGVNRLLKVLYCEIEESMHSRNIDSDNKTNFWNKTRESERLIRRFILWATGRENERFFANYSGINLLAGYIVDIYKREGLNSNYVEKAINTVRTEINRKYRLELNVETDNNGNKIKHQHFKTIYETGIMFDYVKGNKSAVESLENIVDMIVDESRYFKKGIHIPKGAILEGPPGTGKTLLAKAMAGSLQKALNDSTTGNDKRCPLIQLTASELADPADPERINRLINDASQYDACVIFIDEIDAIGRKRGHNNNYQILLKLMTAMDGFEDNRGIFFLGATNDAGALDKALTRPGRFDRVIRVELPDTDSRKEILRFYLSNLDLGLNKAERIPDISDDMLEDLAKRTALCSGAQIENFVNEAAILYINSEQKISDNKDLSDLRFIIPNMDVETPEFINEIKEISPHTLFIKCFYEILERDLVGEIQKNDEDEEDNDNQTENKGLYSVAVHETGHALLSLLLFNKKPFEKITLVPRGQALGYVRPCVDDIHNETRHDLENRIMMYMGGRAAEEEIYGEDKVSTGAVQDILQATNCAEAMVFDYGMTKEMGFMALRERQASDLGEGYIYKCSDEMRHNGEQIVNKILSNLYEKTRGLIKENRELLITLSKSVYNNIEMTGDQFKEVYNGMIKKDKES